MSSVDSVGRRLGLFLSQQGIGVNEAGKRLNSSGPQVSRMVKGGNFNLDMLMRVFETFPELSRDWLLYGQGPMLKGLEKTQQQGRLDNIYEELEQLKEAYSPDKENKFNTLVEQLMDISSLLLRENNKQKNKIISQYEQLNRYRMRLDQIEMES
ncbi:MAG: hypothetical protein AAFQ98_16315 [Bacteroidota bacterium]